MSKFNRGDKVVNNFTKEKGFIVDVYPPRRGRQLYKVKYADYENDENSANLIPDVDLTDPFERCRQNFYNQYTEYLKENTIFKIQSTNNSTISSLKASRTLFKAYQFKPLLKFLNSENRRILIADEVGLGKTIEAGHILLELKAREELKNALIVCPASLRSKWQTELNEKFGFNFIEIDSKDTLLHELKYHNGQVRAVVNYDKIREDSDIINYVVEHNIKFSIIVCDESHKLRNSKTLVYHGTEKLLSMANSVIFMSATPIMIDEENLYNQLHLLEPEQYDNPEVFINNIQLNKPFIRALSQLKNGVPLYDIESELSQTIIRTTNTINDIEFTKEICIGEYFKEYPIYKQIVNNLLTKEDTLELRAKIQADLSEMSPMSTIFTRTRKRDVTQDWSQAERNPIKKTVKLYQAERDAYEKAIRDIMKKYDDNLDIDANNSNKGGFATISLKRQLASSVWATLNEFEDLLLGVDKYANLNDSKFESLLEIIQTVFNNTKNKIIIFAVFKKTLKYLQIRLQKAGYKSVVIYGDTSINKNDVLQQFQTDDTIQILLSSEVGSEGLDMQFCNSMVNYDLPWNPMVVEQRIGRIDRFGQESAKVNIYNIIVVDSILERIYARLLTRIGIFKESIGDLEAILEYELKIDGKTTTIQDELTSIEHGYYSDKLTEEEIKRKEIEIARAIENERLNLKNIEEGLTNTLTNDSYFRDEVEKIEKHNAYVTSRELYLFIVQIIKEHLTTCKIVETNRKGVFEFIIPPSTPTLLKRFLEQYEPQDSDGQRIFRRYIEDIRDKSVLKLTFDQEIAFKDKSISFINLYHPIVRAGVKMFNMCKDKNQCTFVFSINSQYLPSYVHKGKYMLAIYKVSIIRILFDDKPSKIESLYPILFDIENDCITSQEFAEQLMGCAQIYGENSTEFNYIDGDTIEDIRYDMKDCINKHVEEVYNDIDNRIKNSKKIRSEQTTQYYTYRINKIEKAIETQENIIKFSLNDDTRKNAERILPVMRANLRNTIQVLTDKLENINKDAQLQITNNIHSLNLINVI